MMTLCISETILQCKEWLSSFVLYLMTMLQPTANMIAGNIVCRCMKMDLAASFALSPPNSVLGFSVFAEF